MVLEPTAVLDSMLYEYVCFLALGEVQAVLLNSNLRALQLNVAR